MLLFFKFFDIYFVFVKLIIILSHILTGIPPLLPNEELQFTELTGKVV